MRLNVFFIHAAALKDRERVIAEFNKQVQKYHFKNIKKVQIKVITEFDPNDITGDFIQRAVNYTPIKEDIKENSIAFYNQFIKNMHLYQLSNALKHYKALEYIANADDDTLNIVLEDDVVYEEKVCLLLERMFKNLPTDYDMIFLGLPGKTEVTNRNEIKYVNTPEVFRVLPYTDSYLITKDAAKRLYDAYLPIKFAGNVHLSYLIEKTGMKTLTALPNIFIDGSKYGAFLSTLNPNNALVFNQDFIRIKSTAMKDTDITPEEKQICDKIISESPIQGHPDFMYAKAQYLLRFKRVKEAEKLFEHAFNVYTANNCIVNHESMFLKDYIRMHKHNQTDLL